MDDDRDMTLSEAVGFTLVACFLLAFLFWWPL